MVNVSFLKKKVGEFHKEATEIQKLGIEVLNTAGFSGNHLRRPDYRTPEADTQREAVQRYQRWYVTSLRLVEEFLPEWLDTFKVYYRLQYNNTMVIEYCR